MIYTDDIKEAIEYCENEIRNLKNAPKLNGCKMTDDWKRLLKHHQVMKTLLERELRKRGKR